jgi:hypothetical protein
MSMGAAQTRVRACVDLVTSAAGPRTHADPEFANNLHCRTNQDISATEKMEPSLQVLMIRSPIYNSSHALTALLRTHSTMSDFSRGFAGHTKAFPSGSCPPMLGCGVELMYLFRFTATGEPHGVRVVIVSADNNCALSLRHIGSSQSELFRRTFSECLRWIHIRHCLGTCPVEFSFASHVIERA